MIPAASILSFFGSRLGIGVLGGIAFAMSVAYFNFKIHGLEKRIVGLEQRVIVERSAKLELKRNRDELLSEIEQQNATIERMKLELDRANVLSEERVNKRLSELNKEREKVLENKTHGHEEMNQWLENLF